MVLDGRVGGPQRRIAQVGARLRERGWETLVVFPDMGPDLPRYLEDRGLAFERLALSRIRLRHPVANLLRYAARLPVEVARLIALFRRRDVALVHANGMFSLQVALAARLAGRPLIWHFNDTSLPAPPCRAARAILGGLASRRAYSGRRARAHYGEGEGPGAAILYPPVDLERFDPSRIATSNASGVAALDRRGREVILLAAGHLNPLKGYEYLLDALGRLGGLETPWRLVVIGEPLATNPAYAARLEARIDERGLRDRVAFAGGCERMPEAFAACDIFVISSIAESGPMVLLEALAMNKPVVATDVGVVDEVLRDRVNGLVVPPRDAGALSRALRRIVDDRSLREELARHGREAVSAKFSLQAAADAHHRLYDRLISCAGSPGASASSAAR